MDYLFEVGPGTGDGALTFQEIAAWCSLTGRELEPWEVQTLRRMSSAYLSEATEATDPKRPAPAWYGEAPAKEVVAKTLLETLTRMEEQDRKRR